MQEVFVAGNTSSLKVLIIPVVPKKEKLKERTGTQVNAFFIQRRVGLFLS